MKNEKHKNLKERLINFFKKPKEVISFFLPIIITICLLIPVPYYIKLGGGTISLDDKISIDGEKDKNASLDALYVKEAKGVVLTYLLSYVVPGFDKEKIEEVRVDNDSDYNYREKLYFTTSLDAATKVAFSKAGKDVSISSSKFLVLYVDKSSKSSLKVGDQILEIDNKSFNSYEEMTKLVENASNKKKLKIKVKRDDKDIITYNELIKIDNKYKLGVAISNEIKYTSTPKVDFNFSGKQAGPSGGFMIALTIYNKLVDEDVTHGKKIVGTGTIDTDGVVGEIGGIKYKLIAASKSNADIVFVPKDNYKEAKKQKDEKKYTFDLVSISTFDDALEYLNKLK